MAFSSVLKDSDVAAALAACKGDSSSYYICKITIKRPPLCAWSVCLEHIDALSCGFFFLFFLTTCTHFSDAGTFDHKKFFVACGMAGKSSAELKEAFNIIDQDKSGFIEEDELK